MTNLTSILALLDAILLCGLAMAVLRLRPRSVSQWSSIAGMLALGAESASDGLSVRAGSADAIIHWQQAALFATAFVPGTWLIFSLCYSRGNYREFLERWRVMWIAALVVPVGLAVSFGDRAVSSLIRSAIGS